MGMLKRALTGGLGKKVASGGLAKAIAPAISVAKAAAKAAPVAAVGGMAAGLGKRVEPALGDASMKGAAPAMSNPNVYKAMQPTVEKAAATAAKPAVGAALQKKSLGKVITRGLMGRR